MTRRSFAFLWLAVGVSAILPPLARAQVRDRPVKQSPLATAVIAGRAVLLVDGHEEPVRRARVVLTSDHGEPLATQSDTNGGFRFSRLTAGTYQVSIEKAGFVHRSPSPSVELATGQSRAVDVAMLRAGSISGRITSDTGEPAVRAIVSLDRVLASGERGADPHRTRTDDLGRFRLHSLPAGRYVVHACCDGVTNQDVFFPGTTRREDGAVISVGAGQEIEQVDVPFASGETTRTAGTENLGANDGLARITGVVVASDTRRPVGGATVWQAPFGGVAKMVRTDDNGRFALTGLAAGERFLGAQPPRPWNLGGAVSVRTFSGPSLALKDGEAVDGVVLFLMPQRAITGRVLDEFGDPVPGMKVGLARRAFILGRDGFEAVAPDYGSDATDDRGYFRLSGVEPGDYYLRVATSRDTSATDSGPSGFAPTNQPVRVGTGDALDVDVSLMPVPVASLTGVVLGVTGLPSSGATVRVTSLQDGGLGASLRTATDGDFHLRDLPVGAYRIAVSSYEGVGALDVFLAPGSGNDDAERFTISVRPFGTVRGRIRFDGDAPAGWSAATRLVFTSADRVISQAAHFSEDGRFETESAMVPAYVRVVPPLGWKLRSVTLDGRDVTDAPIDFRHDVAGLDVALTNLLGAVTGTVTDGSRPVAGAAVMVFPEDAGRGAWPSRFTSIARSRISGSFAISDLLPGAYLVLAVPSFLGDPDPAWLARMRPFATPVQIDGQQSTTVALTLRQE